MVRYADGANTNLYSGAGGTVKFSYSGPMPANWTQGFAATAGTFDGDTLTMPAAGVTVSAVFTPPAAYAAHWQAGADHDGTSAERAYIITTPAGLQLLSSEVNDGRISDQYFQRGADIDLGAVTDFDPIGL